MAAHGTLVATAGYDNQVILWDGASREPVAGAVHDHLVNHCSFSSDGRWLVSASSDGSGRIWSVPDMKLHVILSGHDDDVDMATFSPNDTLIATCALDRCVRIFDRAGRCLHTLRGHVGNVLSLAWTPDGRQLVSSSVDGTLRHWDVQRGCAIAVTPLGVRTDSVAVGPDRTLYAGDDRGRIAVIKPGEVEPTFFLAHAAGVKKIALNAQLGTLVSMSYDRSIAVWRLEAGALREVSRGTLPQCIWARAAAVLDDGDIAAGTFGSTYALFNPADGLWDTRGVAAGDAVNAVLSIDGLVYSVGDAGVVHVDGIPRAEMGSLCNFLVACAGRVLTGGQLGELFDACTGEVLHAHHSPLNCGVSFVKDRVQYVAIGTYTGEILIFSVTAGGGFVLQTTLAVYENAVKGLSYSDDQLFSVCASAKVSWHRVGDWSVTRQVDHAHERIVNACCAVGTNRFASVSRDRSLRLWASDQMRDDESHASPHRHSVKCLAIDDDGRSLLTGSYGGTLALFDLISRRWTPMTRPTCAGISSISWDGRQRRFLAASYDGGIYPYPIDATTRA